MINRYAVLTLAFLLAAPVAAAAAPKMKPSVKPRKAAPVAAAELETAVRPFGEPDLKALLALIDGSGAEKKNFKAYLKRRLGKIKEQRKSRKDFLNKEDDAAKAFSDKLFEDRETFEERMVKQTEDMFASLSSLDKADHSRALADIERTQTSLSKLFEVQQKQKAAEFFVARDARWKDFIVKLEHDRAEFVAEAASDWRAIIEKPAPAAEKKASSSESSSQ